MFMLMHVIIIVVYIVSHDMIKSVHNEICMIMLLQQIINQHDFQTSYITICFINTTNSVVVKK